MKITLLKIEDELFEELADLTKEEKESKLSFIKKWISDSIIIAKRRKLEKQLKKEVGLINELGLDKTLLSEFETASLTDLQ